MRSTRSILHDPVMFWLAFVVSALGLIVIFDAGYARSLASGRGPVPAEFWKQGLFFVVSLITFAFIRIVPRDTLFRWAKPVLWLSVASLIAVEVVGKVQNGAKRWISIGPIDIQPAEFAKIAIVIYLAAVIARRAPWPTKWPARWKQGEWLQKVAIPKVERLWPGLVILIIGYLIEREKDLGTAAVVLVTAAGMFVAFGISRKSLVAALAIAGLGGTLLVGKEAYRMERINAHVTRWSEENVDDMGFQTCQSELAMASGGIGGVGVGNGRAKHIIPATTTDFVMATVGEELGVLGPIAILGLVGAIVWRLWINAMQAANRFTSAMCAGIGIWFTVQSCTNMMMANATLPAIGIPFPFISSGGSSLVALWLALGLCEAVMAPSRVQEGSVRLIVTGGGTGGHVYPALEVARLAQQNGHEIVYLGSLNGQEKAACERLGIAFYGFDTTALTSIRTRRGVLARVKMLRALRPAKEAVAAARADIVFSTGGYSSGPVMQAAKVLGTPMILHACDAVPGRALRKFAPVAKAMTATFHGAAPYAPNIFVRTGHPIRDELRASMKGGDRRENLVVGLGGSQGSVFLNQAVMAVAAELPEVHFVLSTGPKHLERCRSVANGANIELKPFIEAQELAELYSRATLAIARSGGTIAEFAMAKLPSILVPLPSASDDHQTANAREFESMRAATRLQQPAEWSEGSTACPESFTIKLRDAINFWRNDASAREVASNSLTQWDVPNATHQILETLLVSVGASAKLGVEE